MTVQAGALVAPKRPSLAAEPLLVALDAIACATLALFGALCARTVDPYHFFLSPSLHAVIALPFALLGPLGAGIERGRASLSVGVCAALGAALGAAIGGWWLEGDRSALLLVVRVAPPLALGPVLAMVGARLHRPEESWRPEARLRPPEATPEFAFTLARLRLPLLLRMAFLPLGLALTPFAVAGLVLIRCYQLAVSRFLPPQCRFEPSCSRYGFQAIFRLGALKGFLLTAFRLARCQPFCRAGHDPVPDAFGRSVDDGPSR